MHEVLQLPRSSSTRLILPPLPLLILDAALILASSLKVTIPNSLSHNLPELPTFPVVHFVDALHADLLLWRSHIREDLLVLGMRYCIPLALVCINCVSVRSVKHSLEGVCLARKVSLSLVLERRNVSCGASNVRRVRELNIRASIPNSVNPELRERDNVFLGSARGKLDRKNCMANLTDDDGAAAKRGLLRGMALESKTLGLVRKVIRGLE